MRPECFFYAHRFDDMIIFILKTYCIPSASDSNSNSNFACLLYEVEGKFKLLEKLNEEESVCDKWILSKYVYRPDPGITSTVEWRCHSY